MSEPMVTYAGFLDMQVCVPEDWDDEKVKAFAEFNNPCGTQAGWQVRKQERYIDSGSPDLERMPCIEREGMVHIMLDA